VSDTSKQSESKAPVVLKCYTRRRGARPWLVVGGRLGCGTSACWRRWITASKEAFFAELGLFTMTEAHALASRPRWGNHRLESRVRENRKPFT